jgi:hypothetical protein
VFSYVPYFMPNPFYVHRDPAPMPAPARGAPRPAACDQACVQRVGEGFMNALASQRPQDIPWAPRVRFTENGVPMMIGDGVWASIRRKGDEAVQVADARTGTYAWYGLVYDHDAPAYAGFRLKLEGDRVADVEAVIARERNPAPWAPPAQFRVDPAFAEELPAGERTSRSRLVAAVEAYARSMESEDGRVTARIDPACVRRENGLVVTSGEGASAVIAKEAGKLAQGCEAQIRLGLYRPLEALRDRRVVAVDEARGLVVVHALADFPLRQTEYQLTDGRTVPTSVRYPSTRELFEVYRVRAGRIERVDAVSVIQPYRMPSRWRTTD